MSMRRVHLIALFLVFSLGGSSLFAQAADVAPMPPICMMALQSLNLPKEDPYYVRDVVSEDLLRVLDEERQKRTLVHSDHVRKALRLAGLRVEHEEDGRIITAGGIPVVAAVNPDGTYAWAGKLGAGVYIQVEAKQSENGGAIVYDGRYAVGTSHASSGGLIVYVLDQEDMEILYVAIPYGNEQMIEGDQRFARELLDGTRPVFELMFP